MIEPLKEKTKRSIGGRLVLCVIILAFSVGGFVGLKSLRKPPVKKVLQERPLQVETILAHQRNVPVLLTGYGELASIRELDIASEVSGKIIEIHPRLYVGEVIQEGELLFAIDESDYRIEYEMNRERLAILEKDLDIARRDLSRVTALFDKNKVGTAAGVEGAEKTLNNAADRVAQVRQAMQRASLDLERCRVVAPFTSRITGKMIEKGLYVSRGQKLLSLADDSELEVEIPIYGRDAVQWISFGEMNKTSGNWYGGVDPVDVLVRWTEMDHHSYTGRLHRVSSYSSETRSVKVVVRISGPQGEQEQRPPLVAGMFVSAEIPGRLMQGVIRLPRSAVSFENMVRIVRDQRLYSKEVELVRVQGDYAYVRGEISNGEHIIVTRMVSPLEGSRVQIIHSRKAGDGEK